MSRSSEALTRLVAAISRVDSVEDAYELALRGIEESVAPDRCAMLVHDDALVMRFRAWRGLSDGYRAAVEGHSPWAPDVVAPEPIVVSDVREAVELRPFLDTILGEGIQALAFIPLMARRLVGKFMLYFDRPHVFTPHEIAMAQTVAGVVAFAVERIRAEAAARESEAFLKRLVESSFDCIKVLDRDGRLLSMSPGGMRLLEIDDVTPMLHRSWIDFWRGADREAARHAVAQAAAGGVGKFEGDCPTMTGTPRSWDVVITPVPGRDGRPERLLAVSRDVTERKRMEAALREREQYLRAVIETTPECVKVVAADGTLLEINRAGLEMVGAAGPEAVVGASVYDLVAPEHRALFKAFHEGICRGERGMLEFEIVGLQGRRRVMETHAVPLRGPDGTLMQLATTRDITERRRAQALIVGQNAALEMIARGEPLSRVLETLALVVDEHAAGKAVASILLLDAEGRLHNGASPGLPGDYLAAIEGLAIGPEIGTCAAAAARRELIVTPDIAASPWWAAFAHLPLGLGLYACWSMPIFSGSGEVLGTFGTYLREVREPTREEIQTVEALTRTASVAIERARAAQALATALERERDANQAKDEFLAVLSHELRTPLNAMLGWTLLLRKGGTDARTTERALESVERNTRLLAKLIEDLLDVSRIMSGKLALELRPTPLRPVVEAAVESVRHAADAKGLAVAIDFERRPAEVLADPTRLQQVVWNVLANAVKFTPAGGRVTVRVAAADGRAEIRVSDTGCGIDPEVLPVVFDPFRQSDSTSRRAHGGLGLGLAIVRHLVQGHGGQVRAESEGRGRGATFVITLPLAPVGTDTEAARAHGDRSDRRGPRLDGLHLVVVDDDPDARDLFVMALTQSGALVTPAASLEEALAAIERARPDVLVADISMPRGDGYDLIRAVRAADNGRRLPAIAVTAHARLEDRERALRAGYDAHVAKPVDLPALVSVTASVARGEPVSST